MTTFVRLSIDRQLKTAKKNLRRIEKQVAARKRAAEVAAKKAATEQKKAEAYERSLARAAKTSGKFMPLDQWQALLNGVVAKATTIAGKVLGAFRKAEAALKAQKRAFKNWIKSCLAKRQELRCLEASMRTAGSRLRTTVFQSGDWGIVDMAKEAISLRLSLGEEGFSFHKPRAKKVDELQNLVSFNKLVLGLK